ncbi:MAG: CSN-associated deubiquitinating enzyme Ubp12 [Geoglossum umbratile]|nr:MAG: CSN-associated deubiquitinating enzyme Ubp12 [Geoglossum umbratile]
MLSRAVFAAVALFLAGSLPIRAVETRDTEADLELGQLCLVPGSPCVAYLDISGNCTDDAGSDFVKQQKCVCDGGFFQNLKGCMDCARLHGATAGWVPKSFVDQLSTTLCTGTPSLGILDRIDQIVSTYTPDLAKESGYGTNVLGNATEVSLYYTTTGGSATHTTATTTTTTTAAPGSKPTGTETKTGSGTAGATATGTGNAGSARVLGMGTCLGTVVLAVLVVVADVIPGSTTNPATPSARAVQSSSEAASSLVLALFVTRLTPRLCLVLRAATRRGQLSYTTSSLKKRKIAQPTDSVTDRRLREDVSTVSASIRGSQSFLLPRHPPHAQTSSPPRYIPPHLHDEFLESPAVGGSVPSTPDYCSTAASSPSAAYAGLTLDGDEGGEMSRTDNDGEAVVEAPNQSSVAAASPVNSHNSITMGGGVALPPERSSSPAIKRPASVMNGEDATQYDDVDMVATPPSPDTLKASRSESIDTRTYATNIILREPPSTDIRRHKRSTSVDMLNVEHVASSNTDSSTSGSSDNTSTSVSETTTTCSAVTDSSQVSVKDEEPKDIPSIDEQIGMVTGLVQRPLQDGQKGFVISNKWLQRVLARSSNKLKDDKVDKEATEGEIGPVDNSDLVAEGWTTSSPPETDESRLPFLFPQANSSVGGETDSASTAFKDEKGEPFIPLKPLVVGEDFEILPVEAWDLVIKWYGLAEGSPTITRYAHNTNPDGDVGNLQYEITPPIFTIIKLRNDSNGITIHSQREAQAKPIRILACRSENFQAFLRKVKSLAGIDLQTKVRIWRILGGIGDNRQAGIMTPLASRSASPAPNAAALKDAEKRLVLDLNAFISLQEGSQREVIDLPDQTANTKYNGHMTLNTAGLARDETIVLEEQIGGPGGGEWVSDAVGRVASKNGIPLSVTKNGTTVIQNKNIKPKASSGSGRHSPAPISGGIMTRGREKKEGRALGTCGLSNLGNTCYMNSALQCVRSVEELTRYFIADEYKKELNVENPLAHNGEVAKAFGTLLHLMLAPNSPVSVAPRQFKNTIGRYGPSFSGYGQQDSQEFLGFLLDGLQEDLNRIQKKPYIEKPDSTDDMVNDPAALLALANKCWDIYKARNDSVVADLFAGTYKSTLVCPVCEKVSITFDPFSNLTLQLPIENIWSKEVYFFPLSGTPMRVVVEMDKNGSIKGLKEFIGSKMGVDPRRLHGAEIFKCRFYKTYEDYNSVSDSIGMNDDAAFFELEDIPTNFPPTKKSPKVRSMIEFSYGPSDEDEVPSWDSPRAERMLVPVFHRLVKNETARYQNRHIFAIPFYIILTREEARDHDAILKKILERVDTMTSLDIFRDLDDSEELSNSGDSVTPTDSDMGATTEEDQDSPGGAKIQTKSVDGDCVMVDASQAESPTGHQRQDLKPARSIPSRLRTLFDMKIFPARTELVPTGWSILNESDRYENLASRIRSPSPTPPAQTPLDAFALPTGRSPAESEEDLEETAEQPNNHISPTNPGSESESEYPDVRELVNSSLSRKNKQTSRSTHTKSGGYRGQTFGGSRKPERTYSKKKGKQLSNDRAFDSDDETDDGPLIRLGEGIVLDWNARGHDLLFGGQSIGDPQRGSPIWERMETFVDEDLRKKRELRDRRRRAGISLYDCLDEFGKEEILSENDAWYCPRCKEHRRASKTFELWKSPDILVIHLKRFSANRGFRDKIDVLVDFPTEGLDLTNRVALKEEGKETIYDLIAVDNHYGGLGGGHYTATAKNFFDGQWYEYNDSSVSRKTPESAVTAAAYLLFYRRRSSRPLGGPLFERVFYEQDRAESESSSQAESPAGDDQRLGDSSHNGSSSAYQGRGASRQRADGSSGMNPAEGSDSDKPPEYFSEIRSGETMLDGTQLEDMDETMGEDEDGIDPSYSTFRTSRANTFLNATWGFGNIQGPYRTSDSYVGETTAPPGSDEGLVDDSLSTGAANGSDDDDGGMDLRDRMKDFPEDEAFNSHSFETNSQSGRGFYSLTDSPAQEDPPAYEELHIKAPVAVGEVLDADGGEEAPVAEVYVEEGEGLVTASYTG